MKPARDIMILVCLIILVYILAVIALHIPYWTKATSLILKHVDVTIGRGQQAMDKFRDASVNIKDSTEQFKTASKEFTQRMQELQDTIKTVNTTIGDVDHTVKHTDDIATDVTERTTDLLITLNEDSNRIVRSATASMDAIPPTLESGQRMFDATSRLLSGPVSDSFVNTNKFLLPASLFMSDTQKKWHEYLYPTPYNGKYRKLRLFWDIGRRLPGLAQPSYYTIQLIRDR